MLKQTVNQGVEDKNMEVALEALGKGIARWTDKPDHVMTAIPGLLGHFFVGMKRPSR